MTRRTYNRPLNKEGTQFETWEQTVDRVVGHQQWLWERSKGGARLTEKQKAELAELRQLMLDRKAFTSGRVLWMGGTDVGKSRESSLFNCVFLEVASIWDMVDAFWLLLQGAGVGFKPRSGMLNGFVRPIPSVEIVRSVRTAKGGRETNLETWNEETRVWTISVGDSAEAWAKSVGKLMAGKYPASRLVIDFSEIRPAGERLRGYGWISSGDGAVAKAYEHIAQIMNRRAGCLLTKMDILDIINWLGTVLSSRRSAQIALFDYNASEWEEFAVAKKDYWLTGNPQRAQSNNSLLFWDKPTKAEIQRVFQLMVDSGGSEPGFINAAEAKRRAPWFVGVNPCGEILLGHKSVCNLTEVDVSKFVGDTAGLLEAIKVAARANYRQTCVNFKDGILSEEWHLNNQFLRLCGVGITGIAMRPDLTPYDFRQMERVATASAFAMADELGLPRPKNVTTIKPSGTLSKVADCTEGGHKPLGRYIFNNVNFSSHDPLVEKLKQAGYRVRENPLDPTGVLVTMPVKWAGVEFDRVDGVDVNLESATDQLDRYKMLQSNYTQQNTSVTVSYSPEEVPAIVDWLDRNWSSYVGVSFLYRTDPTKTAADLGYPYLPQEVVTKGAYEEYANSLKPIDINSANSFDELKDDGCATGACPVK